PLAFARLTCAARTLAFAEIPNSPVCFPRACHLQSLLELIEYGGIFQRRYVLRDRLALGDRAQQAPPDLARARLGQIVAEADVLGLRDWGRLPAHPVAALPWGLPPRCARGPRLP